MYSAIRLPPRDPESQLPVCRPYRKYPVRLNLTDVRKTASPITREIRGDRGELHAVDPQEGTVMKVSFVFGYAIWDIETV